MRTPEWGKTTQKALILQKTHERLLGVKYVLK